MQITNATSDMSAKTKALCHHPPYDFPSPFSAFGGLPLILNHERSRPDKRRCIPRPTPGKVTNSHTWLSSCCGCFTIQNSDQVFSPPTTISLRVFPTSCCTASGLMNYTPSIVRGELWLASTASRPGTHIWNWINMPNFFKKKIEYNAMRWLTSCMACSSYILRHLLP